MQASTQQEWRDLAKAVTNVRSTEHWWMYHELPAEVAQNPVLAISEFRNIR